MQPSPFTPGSVATEVIGREKWLTETEMQLALLRASPRFAGRITVFVGPRGVGKTSLLRATERKAAEMDFVCLWVTAGDGSVLESLVGSLSKVAHTWRTRSADALKDMLSGLETSLGGVTVTSALGSQPDSIDPAFNRKLQEVLVKATTVAQDHHKSGIALFIDELQLADNQSLRLLAYAWQHMQSEQPEIPAICFTAGLGNSHNVVTNAVCFAERFRYVHLGNLTPRDAAAALQRPATNLGVEWDESALSGALAIADGYPYFLQVIGEECWKAASYPEPGETILPGHFAEGRREFQQTRDDFFRARWTKATPKEAELLVAMASLGDEPVQRRDLADHMHTTSAAISMARAALIDKGIIGAEQHGYLSFTAPGFAEYVRTYHGLEANEASSSSRSSGPGTPP